MKFIYNKNFTFYLQWFQFLFHKKIKIQAHGLEITIDIGNLITCRRQSTGFSSPRIQWLTGILVALTCDFQDLLQDLFAPHKTKLGSFQWNAVLPQWHLCDPYGTDCLLDLSFFIITQKLSFVCLFCLVGCFSCKWSTQIIQKKLQHDNRIYNNQRYNNRIQSYNGSPEKGFEEWVIIQLGKSL